MDDYMTLVLFLVILESLQEQYATKRQNHTRQWFLDNPNLAKFN